MKRTWWKEAVVYQVYWRSFYDSNGDGIGDLQGVIEKLDYIKDLGVDVIWLNPCYDSPDIDYGYDIRDYYSIMKKAGTVEIWNELLEKVHAKGMKLMMDLVVNHTSNQHPWFLESCSSKNNPKRDYYIWRPGKDGNPPNNWRSYFTPSAWEYDERTDEYYFHSFATEQPDLNWENPTLREEIYKMMRFWLDKGIDGFRLDAIALLKKQDGFPNAENPDDIRYLTNNPGIHIFLQELNEKVLNRYDILTVGEVAFVGPDDGVKYVGEDRNELHSLFHFEVCDEMPDWDLQRYRDIQNRWYAGLWKKGWNSQFLNNHDHTRQVTRYGNDNEFRVESAKLLATMIHTLPGTPYIYQGEEIGMTGVDYQNIEDYKDIAFHNKYEEEVSKGRNPSEVFEELKPLARDNSRSPMQWSDQKNAGFSMGKPWIKVNPNYKEINVENESANQDSVLNYYKNLIQLRKQNLVMIYGDYQDISNNDPRIYAYTRKLDSECWLILLNHSDKSSIFEIPETLQRAKYELILSNYSGKEDWRNLRPYEARIYRLIF
ncbi:oligo-1,6-glucosidase [Heyndrickxia shackletonii]|uniref:oligo-1,6-glucosidase n=1 Tax=Heyndrickxia shackletonii TaxID=157838 RepID=A0A0Q3WVZ3_9BACI|nr:alpha-glucosidase [Heyndrickxia shackletonii]KQL53020.1 oligo-1,6-glucosidase [Heyndrickxia shackletonii]NEY98572.1 alpha-glucosidase [Heyndrickxia shackletonii]